jgi:cytochrome c553
MTLLRRAALLLLLLLMSRAGVVHTQTASAPARIPSRIPSQASEPGRIVGTYCMTCHNDQARTAGLSLSAIDVDDAVSNAEVLEKVLYKLRTGQMPPAGMPTPEPQAVAAAVSQLEAALDRAAIAKPMAGRVGFHRLNRSEYANAVRDLLSVEVDPKTLLLPDESDEGFDNVATALTFSPAHFDRYLSAARKISRLAVGDTTLGEVPAFKLYQIPRTLNQEGRVSEDLPFGSRGGQAIRHNFVLDGYYVIKLRLRRQIYDYIIGLGEPQNIDVRIDGKRVNRFTIGGAAQGTPSPLTYAGEIVGEIEWETYMHTADEDLQVRVPVSAGVRTVSVSFVRNLRVPEGVPQPPEFGFGLASDQLYDGYAAVDTISIAGPYSPQGAGETASRGAIFVCHPSASAQEETCARTILSKLARRAYRRPVKEDEMQDLLGFFRENRKTGSFDSGIQAAIERLLVSFNFLFRREIDPPNAAPGTVYRISALDLASQLSFFVWSSIPDNELLDTAVSGKLKEPAVLAREVRRMLADSRSEALVENFADQWLGIRKAGAWHPDPDQYPDFDENLRDAFLQETRLFIDGQMREDRSIIELLSANYTFVNERLARHYGIPDIHGVRFRRVAFDDGIRGGLLGMGSILMVTSNPDRTSPVLRGLWVLDNLLGMRPPPPPQNVPDLETKSPDGHLLSLRAQMEQHRKSPACASCHLRMDPVGFSLENFDGIGRWRNSSGGSPIDASAVFPDGTKFDGISGLRALLLNHRDDFVRAFTTRLLTYALGRGVAYYDAPSIRKIMQDGAGQNYRWSSIILGIVNSTAFQMRRTAS